MQPPPQVVNYGQGDPQAGNNFVLPPGDPQLMNVGPHDGPPVGNFVPPTFLPPPTDTTGREFVKPPPSQFRPFAPPGPPGQQSVEAKKLNPIELVNILLRFLTVLFLFIATVIVGTTKSIITPLNQDAYLPGSFLPTPSYYPGSSSSTYNSGSYYGYPYGSVFSAKSSLEKEAEKLGVYAARKLGSFTPIKYFLAANSIVLIYTMATLVISVASILVKKQPQQPGDKVTTLRNKLIMLFVLGDLLMVVFLFSAAGAAAGSKDMINNKSDFIRIDDNHDDELTPQLSLSRDAYVTSKFCSALNQKDFCSKWTAGIAMSMIGAIAYLVLELLSIFSLTKFGNPFTDETTTVAKINT